jgi:hypothetical protein
MMDVLVLGGNYSFIFNNQKIKNSHDYWFLRINAETAGNLLSALYKISGVHKICRHLYLLGQPFAQYVKVDIDLRYNYKFNDLSSIVYRGFLWYWYPLWKLEALPFEKQYFSGGANDIRAWQVRSLGPGSYNPPNSIQVFE